MAAWLLLVLAAAHMALGLEQGLTEGDFSLLWVAVPFVVLTSLAALAVHLRRSWAQVAALVLTGICIVLAGLLVPIYLLGLFHLPQAALALVVVVRQHERLPH